MFESEQNRRERWFVFWAYGCITVSVLGWMIFVHLVSPLSLGELSAVTLLSLLIGNFAVWLGLRVRRSIRRRHESKASSADKVNSNTL